MYVRIVTNIALGAILFGAGIYLLLQDSFLLRDRWNPGAGTLFYGWPLYLLALGLILLSVFAGSIARTWMQREIPLPPPKTIRPHPIYKRTDYYQVLVSCRTGDSFHHNGVSACGTDRGHGLSFEITLFSTILFNC
jgi:hypothetical protein